jgi:hypothetical protein
MTCVSLGVRSVKCTACAGESGLSCGTGAQVLLTSQSLSKMKHE